MRKFQWEQIGLVVATLAITCGMDWAVIMDPFRDGKVRYALLAAAGLAAFHLRRANPFAAVFALYGAVLWVWSDMSAFGSLDTLMPFVMFGLALEISRRFTVEGFSNLIGHVALFQACYGLLQIGGIEPWHEIAPKTTWGIEYRGTAIGTLGHYVMLTPFAALGLTYFLHRRKWIRAGICGLVIAISPSTMGVLCALAGTGYLAFRKWPKSSAAAGAAAVAGLAVWYHLEPTGGWLDPNGRLFIWPYAIKAWLQAPWFGFGPGSWSGLYPLWEIPGELQWRQTHSDPLQLLPEYGVVGLAIVAAGLIDAYWRARELPAFLGAWVTVLLVNCSANFIMHLAAFGLPAAWVLTVIYRESIVGDHVDE